MKKTIAVLLAVFALICLAACSKKPGGQSTPGDLVTGNQQHVLHTSTGEQDVSGEYTETLCRCPWVDADSMNCYILHEDQTFTRMDQDQTEQLSKGTWKLCKDDQEYLTLYIVDEDAGSSMTMHELELYDQSIYAYHENGKSYIWLLMDEAEED